MMRSPSFLFGLALRLILIVGVLPWTQEAWFIPFLDHVASTRSLDVWGSFVASGGDIQAFPYGAIYVFVFAPGVLLGQALGGLTGAGIGLGLTIIALDLAMLKAIQALTPAQHQRKLYFFYWLSPIVIYIGYWHGQLDLLPTLILTLGLVALKANRLMLAACFLAVSVAAKVSMIAAIPFVILYLMGSHRYRPFVIRFGLLFVFIVAVTLLPLALLPGFRLMVLGTPEIDKGLALAITYGDGLKLYVLPMAYAALFFFAWRVRRFNFDELLCLIGLVFLALYMLTPAAPGWAMWFAAFLAIHTVRSSGRAKLLYSVLNFSFLGLHLIISTGARLRFGDGLDLTDLPAVLHLREHERLSGIAFSGLVVSGAALAMQMLRERLLFDNFHLATRRPLMVGIVGDSGAGKDTLCAAVADFFGPDAVTAISGDDYHSWDRHRPMWRAMTHLNPKANNLDRFAADALQLGAGRPVRSRVYDHQVGRMTKPRPVSPRDVVIVSGLHALYVPQLNARYDLKVFLDMEESVRRYFKIRRDVTDRGHTRDHVLKAIEARAADGAQFIQPQKQNADLSIRLETLRPKDLTDYQGTFEAIEFRLRVSLRQGRTLDQLANLLVSVCGLWVHEETSETGASEIIIEGSPSAESVAIVAEKLAPDMRDHIALAPVWHGGQIGLMQLIMLDQMDRVRDDKGGMS